MSEMQAVVRGEQNFTNVSDSAADWEGTCFVYSYILER